MKHLIPITHTQGPKPANILGTQALITLLLELVQLVNDVSMVMKGVPLNGGGGGGDGDPAPPDDEHADH